MNSVAQVIVTEIIDDLSGRSGGDHFFGSIDMDIYREMLEDLDKIVRGHLFDRYGYVAGE